MASIIITCVPGQGHVAPLLAVARNFVERGDDVRFITGSRFAEKISSVGATHIPLTGEADFDESKLDEHPERARLKGLRAGKFDVEHFFARPANIQYEILAAALAARPADVILTDPVFMGTKVLLGYPRTRRPAVVMCSIIPLPIPSRDTAPYGVGLPPARRFNRARNAMLTVLSNRIVAGADVIVNDLHRQVHGTDMPDSFVDWGRRAEAILQFTVEAFEYPRSDAPPQLRFVGPLSATGSQAPLPPWWAELDGSRPVIHVTQGTVANRDYEQLIAPTLRALAEDDVLVAVATGGRPVDTLPLLPANARAAEFLPYDELLPRTAVYVTNGGYGGVQYALRYGVPIVATGGKEDKPEVGARVAWSGVGRRIRSEYPKPAALRRAIFTVLNNRQYRDASQRIAADLAAAPGFTGFAAVVDGLVSSRTVPGTG
jgi:MGT family glycosyltransferase